MDNKEFKEYVIECKRIGLENSQIARKLGMNLYAFEDECAFAFRGGKKPPEETPKPAAVNPVKGTPAKPMEEFIKESSEAPKVGQKHPGVFEVPQGE